MEDKLYKVDLHIHTPASKCYQGAKTEDEYIQILKRAHENNLDIIAITDHNTIDGYTKLMEIYQRTRDDLKIIERYKNEANPRIEEDIEKDIEILKLYENIVILPGVEITLNPKVHMIVITSDDKVNDIEQLLFEVGYTPDKQGVDSGISINVDIKTFLGNKILSDKVVIAPHVDSDSGIYNELAKSGTYRADIMKSPIIDAMTCNNIEQLKRIKNLLSNEPLYVREAPIAFINSSDAHSTDLIGSRVSYIKMEQRNIECLKKACKNPAECIFDISDNGIKTIINRMIKDDKTYVVNDLVRDDDLFLAKCLCACLNEGIRTIIFGVSPDNEEIAGIKVSYEDMKSSLLAAIKMLNSKTSPFSPRLGYESLGNGRNVYFIFLDTPKYNFWYFEETQETYTLIEGVQKAKLYDIERLIYRNALSKLKNMEERNNKRVNSMVTNMNSLANMAGKLDIIQRIESRGTYLVNNVEIEVIESYKGNDDMINDIFDSNIGDLMGDTYYIFNSSVRLENAILRYSCPITNTDLSSINYISKQKDGSILISHDGGSYLVDSNEWSIIGNKNSYLCVKLNLEIENSFSIYSLIGWIKSSIFIWYTLRKFDTANIFLPDVFRNIIIPDLNCLKPDGIVEKCVKQIIENEKAFIMEFKRLEDESSKDIDEDEEESRIERLNDFIDMHNIATENLGKQIDEEILTDLQLSGTELEWIVNDIMAEGIYNILDFK